MDQLSEIKVGLSVTAVARQARQVRSVELRHKGRSLELMHLEQADSWQALARQAKVLSESGQRLRVAHHEVVAGLEAVGVAFYRMTLPKVGPQETDAMVRMQAETRLPLSVDQMGLDWKTIEVTDAECTAVVAAMRKNSPGVNEAVSLEPDHIVTEADALVQMWRWGCDETAFEGTGVFLLGAVLEQFFARYVSINSFTETVFSTTERGEVTRWPAKTGRRHVL